MYPGFYLVSKRSLPQPQGMNLDKVESGRTNGSSQLLESQRVETANVQTPHAAPRGFILLSSTQTSVVKVSELAPVFLFLEA
jgi:hypothetical protein